MSCVTHHGTGSWAGRAVCPLNARLLREQGKCCQAEAGCQHVWTCFLHEMSLWVFFHREELSPLLANCFFTRLKQFCGATSFRWL